MSSSTEEFKNTVLQKLRTDPLSITPEDARRLSEQVEVTDRRSAKIVSAVESLAVASEDLQKMDPKSGMLPMVEVPRHVQHALVNDLSAAVDNYPRDVTTDLLKATQNIVSKMQRALGQTNAPHPELEAELQAEIAKIEPKIEQGTVTKAEADHLHSLEARAHGHTEKGGMTALAQSIAAKRERALSLSESTNESQAYRDSSSITKSPLQTGTTSAEDTPDTIASLSLVENQAKDLSRGDTAHGHARKDSDLKAVEAH